jgi:hypothetical protein
MKADVMDIAVLQCRAASNWQMQSFGTKLACPPIQAHHSAMAHVPRGGGKSMNKHIWHKNSFGFWFAFCICLSAYVGWLMMHFKIIR